MFRDDLQRAGVCRTLLGTIGLADLWSERGPTWQAAALADVQHGVLSPEQRVLLSAAWSFWNGSAAVTLSDLAQHLDAARAEIVCFLVLATKHGADAIDDWITENSTYGGTP